MRTSIKCGHFFCHPIANGATEKSVRFRAMRPGPQDRYLNLLACLQTTHDHRHGLSSSRKRPGQRLIGREYE